MPPALSKLASGKFTFAVLIVVASITGWFSLFAHLIYANFRTWTIEVCSTWTLFFFIFLEYTTNRETVQLPVATSQKPYLQMRFAIQSASFLHCIMFDNDIVLGMNNGVQNNIDCVLVWQACRSRSNRSSDLDNHHLPCTANQHLLYLTRICCEAFVISRSEMDEEAWVTLATNDSYTLGALVLGHSLRRVGTSRKLHCMVTTSVTQEMRRSLGKVFDSVTQVDVMDSGDESNLALIQRPDLGVTFTKLNCWKLTQYKKCVFLDADCLVLQQCDDLFDYPELSAAPDIGWPDIFNSGVFVFVPSNETYQNLVKLGVEQGSFDGADQGLLNLFFSDWRLKGPSHRLPYTYNTASSALYTYIAALKRFMGDVKIVHFIGQQKPWNLLGSREPQLGAALEMEFLKTWFSVFTSDVLPTLHPEYLSNRIDVCMERIKALYGAEILRKQMPAAVSDADRQRAWEEGIVDYTGRDSWENIQKRLEETINGEKTNYEASDHHHQQQQQQLQMCATKQCGFKQTTT
ncbi:Glycogenin-1 [Trichinella pseudospiralis]|uniref:glycogenin glucosyltransferase n=1 Tax=Trichinella pseudospiralis TaxID=6337 RepID=A0A0V1FK99_TRIPS|nr:Glycogenin-1 [Trichinella pseudospiralis]